MTRSQPPVAASLPCLRLPEVERRRLASGLKVFLCLEDRVPLAALQLVFPAGALHDPPGLGGLAALTTALLRANASAARRSEVLGTDVLAGTDWDAAVLMVEVLTEDLDSGLDLLSELAWSPAFSEAACARSREARIHALRQRRLNPSPSAAADELFARQVYRGTVYARSQLGDEESLARVGYDEVVRFHGGHYATGGASLLAVGSFLPEALLSKIETTVLAAGDKEPPPLPTMPIPPRAPSQIFLVDFPQAVQVEIRLGQRSIGRADPDFRAFSVLNAVLGGTPSSRIPANLRERHGYAYAVRSHLDGQRGVGTFVVDTVVGVENAAAAIAEILQEIERLRQEPVPPGELASIQTYLAGVMPLAFETSYDILRWLKQRVVDGLPEGASSGALERLWELDPQILLDLAQRHLNPDTLTVVVAGPARELHPSLTRFGLPITVLPGHRLSGDLNSAIVEDALRRTQHLGPYERKWAAANQSPEPQDERR